ncbi:MAG: 3'-5' exonuclease domain-containing protein 2 [Bacteroidaceae bacterium]|nr:3'-5' exonuclease domain-containing protein 2 [Bacteroidaceae bacterium]
MVTLKSRIDKKELSLMLPVAFSGRIIVVQSELEANKAVDYLMAQPLVGIDTETRPSFTRGVVNKVALLQVSTLDTCFLFRLNVIGICPAIKRFLESEQVVKVGLSLKDDFTVLRRRTDFIPGGMVDLQHLVKEMGIKELSLQKVYAIFFGQKISKAQRLSNWEVDVLTDKQKIYAATDAWACVMIYNRMNDLKETGDYVIESLDEEESVAG